MSYYDNVFSDLRRRTEARGFNFHSNGTPGTSLSELVDELSVQPGIRHPFGIETDGSFLVGFIITPNPNREHCEKAWNRFDPQLRERIAIAEREGIRERTLSFVIIQIWETENRCVLIPFKELNRVPAFRETGNFTVLKDCGEFRLQMPSHEPRTRLKDRLEQIFEFL